MSLRSSLLAFTFVSVFCLRVAWADPDLDAINLSVNDTNPDPGDLVTLSWTAINRTGDYVGSSQQGVLFSSDSNVTRSDTLLGREGLGPLGGIFYADSSPELKTVRIPTWAQWGRTYYIAVYADYDRERSESSESNNLSNVVAITIRDPRPDYTASGLTVEDSSGEVFAEPGENIKVEWTARNAGRPTGLTDSSDQAVMWSTDATISSNDTVLEIEGLGPLLAGQTSPEDRWVDVPTNVVLGRTYYIGVIMDWGDQYDEQSESNNILGAIPVTISAPDLVAETLRVGSDVFEPGTYIEAWPGQTLKLSWTAVNKGTASTDLLDFSQQAVRWSSDSVVNRSDTILEREPLGILVPGDDSPELRDVKVPDNAVFGNTYYIAIEADTDREFAELNEDNNFSNVVRVKIGTASEIGPIELSDYNHLPWLDDEDERLQDVNGDDDPDPGVTMNLSRTFNPRDVAYVHTTVEHDADLVGWFFGSLPTRLTAYYNTSPTSSGRTRIGSVQMDVGTSPKRFNVRWTVPSAPGNYYVQGVVEVQVESGEWVTASNRWVDGGSVASPVIVTRERPVILIHGWSDTDGETFADLELLIETILERPVRLFQYETSKFVLGGTANGPRIDEAYTELFTGIEKPSLADQLKEFLANANNGSALQDVDIVAHSMGGLVARNYALKEDNIRRLITLGTPSYGGLFADVFGLEGALNNQAEDLEFGSLLSWKLHREWKARREEMPATLNVVGTNDAAFGIYNQTDNLVTCSSASLESLGFPAYYAPLPHTGDAGLPQVISTTHASWAPIRFFLQNDMPVLPDDLPGHKGNVNDVGHKDHAEALPNGALYIVHQNGNGIHRVLTALLAFAPSPLGKNSVHEDGIYYARSLVADLSSEGSEYGFTSTADVVTFEGAYADRIVTVRAGETTVYVIGGDNSDIPVNDVDGDGLPDFVENEIIDANTSDSLTRHAHVRPADDFDGDGIPELLELAIGTRSTVFDADALQFELREGRVVLRHVELYHDFGLQLVGQRSDGMGNWLTQDVQYNVIDSSFDRQTVEWSTPQEDPGTFLRVIVQPD